MNPFLNPTPFLNPELKDNSRFKSLIRKYSPFSNPCNPNNISSPRTCNPSNISHPSNPVHHILKNFLSNPSNPSYISNPCSPYVAQVIGKLFYVIKHIAYTCSNPINNQSNPFKSFVSNLSNPIQVTQLPKFKHLRFLQNNPSIPPM